MSTVKNIKTANENDCQPTREEAEDAVRTLIRWAGDDPDREGLLDTPGRVTRAYEEFFAGYSEDPEGILGRVFEDIVGYEDFVLVKDIDFVSHCEHHMVPIIGKAHVAYWPGDKIVGISKLARIVDVYAQRLVSQESMTQEIVKAIDTVLNPRGTVVIIDAVHYCMSIRGAAKAGSSTVTSMFSGVFKDDKDARQRVMSLIGS